MLIKTMGTVIFLVGIVLLVVAILVIFKFLNLLGTYERWVVFGCGLLVCSLGYWMARDEEELVIESETGPKQEALEKSPWE